MAKVYEEVTMVVDQKMIDKAVAEQIKKYNAEIKKKDDKIKRLEKKVKDMKTEVEIAEKVISKAENFTSELVDDLAMWGWFDRA
jgi:septal ring factor EnvC (AmiA/AmiB activator)